jgi:hypothetical protein
VVSVSGRGQLPPPRSDGQGQGADQRDQPEQEPGERELSGRGAELAALGRRARIALELALAAAAARFDEVSAAVAVSAAAARALWTRAAGHPGEAVDRTGVVVTTGAAACWTAVTGAGTPATGPFACAGPANQAASAQATAASAKMLPRHGQARLALVNIRDHVFPRTGEDNPTSSPKIDYMSV